MKILIFGIITLLSVLICLSAGCTTTTSGPSPSPGSIDASEFNARYAAHTSNYWSSKIVTPFTKSVNERGHTIYTGTTEGLYAPWNITVEMCKDEADAQHTFTLLKSQALQSGWKLTDEREVLNLPVFVGTKEIPNNTELVNTIIIEIKPPGEPLNIGYYIQTSIGITPP